MILLGTCLYWTKYLIHHSIYRLHRKTYTAISLSISRKWSVNIYPCPQITSFFGTWSLNTHKPCLHCNYFSFAFFLECNLWYFGFETLNVWKKCENLLRKLNKGPTFVKFFFISRIYILTTMTVPAEWIKRWRISTAKWDYTLLIIFD